MAGVLVIDDDAAITRLIEKSLRSLNHEVQQAHTLQDGRKFAAEQVFHVIFLDVVLPDGSGLDVIRELMSLAYRPEIVIITGQNDPGGAELALEKGVFDYLKKPFGINELRLACSRALEFRESRLQKQEPKIIECDGIVGSSALMKDCLYSMARAAAGEHNILITGETGTGKELVAKALHQNSPRAEKNFIIVDCAALKDTLLESTLFGHEKGAFTGAEARREGLVFLADGGTLFLDEIGELDLDAQKSFLRLLEEKRFYPLGAKNERYSDFRLVAATNRDLLEMSRAGEFRADLYYRICGHELHLPPLRERLGDIRDLAFYYVDRICERMNIPVKKIYPEFLEALEGLGWPGNVRELVNTLDEAISSFPEDPALHVRHLPTRIRFILKNEKKGNRPESENIFHERWDDIDTDNLSDWKSFKKQAVDCAERRFFRALFSKTAGEVKEMAAICGLTQARVYDMIKKHGLAKPSA